MRLYTEQDLAADRNVALADGQTHYLRNVMRARPGDEVRLFNGRDGEWSSRIATLDRRSGQTVVEERTRAQAPETGPWLVFAPLKRAPLDFMVQKAVELGAAALQPVLTAHTNTDRINLDRLRANAIEAAEQCERLTVPEIFSPQKYSFLLDNWPAERYLLVCAERGDALPITDALRAAPRGGEGSILIGPEGGFAPAELEDIGKRPFTTLVSLGPRILRAETAALAALTCWQAELGDWQAGRTVFHETSTRTE